MYRITIIDDERRAAEILEAMLPAHLPEAADIRICCNPRQAAEHIGKFQPHLIFLDIKMPGLGGFELLEAIGERNFQVIFVTAYDQFAIPAIKESALDYLLKPVSEDELATALERFFRSDHAALAEKYETLIGQLHDQMQMQERIAITSLERTVFFTPRDIVRCEAHGNYTYFHFADKTKLLSSKTLKEHEEVLENKGFIRVHKSHLVNSLFIKAVLGKSEMRLQDDTAIPIARRRRHLVSEFVQKPHVAS